ncbi:MAG: ectoine hydroxylase-related dioxygenase (phytanoyl-CoA dioxygenase family) [Cellvibrionaceae bacterium]|jgi:ectoine hydroxylase-related dioxygenase (phytanoyl-CoA dioxygenase family)
MLPLYFSEEDIKLSGLVELCSQETKLADYPFAADVQKNIVIYDNARLQPVLDDPTKEQALKAEIARCLKDGPGVLVISGAYLDKNVIDRSTAAFEAIIAQEKAAGGGQGDHFGRNERVWNSVQKACLYDPDLFIDYYKNPMLALVCEAWLGPNYQMTAQVNNVKPRGKAQSAHRDFHLGFQAAETVRQYPAHAQVMSQYLTLQGAIAHCDMLLETGPTLFLPYSQQLKSGYLSYTRPEFRQYFDENHVQIPFAKGDMVFFSPALFHGAGTNISHGDRLANLVQISSAFGRPMETVNRTAMIKAVYPVLLKRKTEGTLTEREIANTIASVAEGYSFPTNLDSDPPIGGNAPETAAQMMHTALAADWPLSKLKKKLKAYKKRQKA